MDKKDRTGERKRSKTKIPERGGVGGLEEECQI
jgi:hypothetical protein